MEKNWNRLIIWLLIAACMATFWTAVVIFGAIFKGWSTWCIPITYLGVWSVVLLAGGLCAASGDCGE